MSVYQASRDTLAAELLVRDAEVPNELLDLYALLVLVRGMLCTLPDVHEAWAVWTLRERPDHRSLIPFDDLTPEVQALDGVYRDAIVAAAARTS